MKTRKNSNRFKILNLLFVLTICISLLAAFSSCAAHKKSAVSVREVKPSSTEITPSGTAGQVDDNEEPFVVVEEMPIFPGGDSMLLDFIARNTKYPEAAKLNRIEGRVILRFCVTAKGDVNRISVLRGVVPELDAEAVRVVSTLPPFKPGRQSGRDVPVWYMVPITFALK
jgi:TonB family protein